MTGETELEPADPPPARAAASGLAVVGAALVAVLLVVGLAFLVAGAGGDGNDDFDGVADPGTSAVTDDHEHPDSSDHSAHGDDPTATDDDHRRAAEIVAATKVALARYADIEAARAAGYVPAAEGLDETTDGYLHLVDPERVADATVVDPEEVESLVYSRGDDGEMHLVAAMFVLPPDQTVADAPDVAGPLAHWHDHVDLCWREDRPGIIAGPAIGSTCETGVNVSPAMLHVWIVDNDCGSFADIVGHGSETDVCGHEFLPKAFEGRVTT
ncbi:MAG TPA: hypothetical protein VFZ83_15140 [Acidimicrobiia bacterium]|nr:hypothetical protein [Acidimicrobiia bacterium]